MTLFAEPEILPTLSRLTDEQRATLAALSRAQRAEALAGFLELPLDQVTARLAEESGLPIASHCRVLRG